MTWLELALDEMGTLDVFGIAKIAKRVQLCPETIWFGDLGGRDGITIADICSQCESKARQSKDSPVFVYGKTNLGTHKKDMLLLAVKCDVVFYDNVVDNVVKVLLGILSYLFVKHDVLCVRILCPIQLNSFEVVFLSNLRSNLEVE